MRTTALTAFAALLATLAASLLFSSSSVAQSQGLADRAPSGFNFGAVLHSYDGSWDIGEYAEVADREFNAITATAYMPWGPTRGDVSPAVSAGDVAIDTAPLDDLVRWAEDPARNMFVHGHVLLYPAANESLGWYQDSRFDGKREAMVRRYIETIAGSNPGGVDVWDVVNEVMADPYQIENDIAVDDWGLRTDFVEYDEIGADYVDEAFRWADAVVDPGVQLIINDYGAEAVNPKSDALLAYVIELRRRGVPIDGVGFQMHVSSYNQTREDLERTISSMETNLRRFADAGFDLYITELDVQATQAPNPHEPTTEQLQAQANMYQAIVEMALRVPLMNTVLLWDFADGRSWMNPTDRVLGDIPIGSYTYPTPWFGGADEQPLRPKPAYDAIGEALDRPVDPLGYRTVRLLNHWDESTGYLLRHGESNASDTYDPTRQARFHGLDDRSDDWSSMWWTIEPVGNGYVRLRNHWEGGSGYLGRTGRPGGGGWQPGNGVFLSRLRSEGLFQQWSIEPARDGTIKFVNRWHPETGVLTRAGINSAGQVEPIDELKLAQHLIWPSQLWTAQE